VTDYNLSGLGTRSFEQLVQSLAAKIIGPNVVIFGDGPDGAREATFEGRIPFPNEDRPWEGYGVIQAKFLQRSVGPGKDGQWLFNQVSGELKKFTITKRRLRKPEYYILATNVILSPVAARGFKDKVSALIRSYKSKIGLKDFDIWDYDKIRVFLDNNRDVATTNAAWISSGDVLAEVIKAVKIGEPDFDQTMSNFLQKELLADQYANLEQAGHVPENQIPLSAVFTDLPASDRRLYEPEEERLPLPAGFIVEVLNASRERLDQDSLLAGASGSSGMATKGLRSGKFVLIGGPGQGKTTLTQYVCQLFRVALLKDRQHVWSNAKVAIRQIREQCAMDQIPLPLTRRFPIRVVLSEFAKALAMEGGDVSSLLSYVVKRIKQRTDYTLSVATFRQWMGNYPWILVLDGLDEVPASSNRDQVLTAITNFWIDVTEQNADILVVATTRPQGYSNEFSPEFYAHKFLTPLSEIRALRYGEKLTSIRYAADVDRQRKVASRLLRAVAEPATARLMRSPLQVTIMAELVGKLGQPPQERYGLFKEYFKVVYDREVERDTPVANILRRYRTEIDAIHYHAGLLLQVESERTGQTDAKLESGRLARIVRSHFSEEGHTGSDLDNLVSQVIAAAGQRLVFLVGVEADQVGFEIRSLQEFMAAEGLMQGDDACIRQRLRLIAPVSNWRSVFLFAAGNCYVVHKHLRDTIHSICAELNEEQSKDQKKDQTINSNKEDGLNLIRAGSQLALDLLEDGSARSQPKHCQALARVACRLLELPPEEIHLRLASVYSKELDGVFREEITKQVRHMDPASRIAAWICVLQLESQRVPWAAELIEKATTKEDLGAIVDACRIAPVSDRVHKTIREAIAVTPPTSGNRKRAFRRLLKPEVLGRAPWSTAVTGIMDMPTSPHFRGIVSMMLNDGTRLYWLYIKPVRPNWIHGLQNLPDQGEDWLPYSMAAKFMATPSPSSLAEALRTIAEQPGDPPESSSMPWPISACLEACATPTDVKLLAERVANGEMGTQVEWLAAEERWRKGVRLHEVFGRRRASVPFDQTIAAFGFPTSAVCSISLGSKGVSLNQVVGELRQTSDDEGRGNAACWMLYNIRQSSGLMSISAGELQELAQMAGHGTSSFDLSVINLFSDIDQVTVATLNRVGLDARNMHVVNPVSADRITRLVLGYNQDTSQRGLLRIIACLLSGTEIPDIAVPSRWEIGELAPPLRNAALIVRLVASGDSADLESVASLVLDPNLARNERTRYLDSAVEVISKRMETEMAVRSLVHLTELVGGSRPFAWKLVQALNAVVRKRRSNIYHPEVWASLKLSSSLQPHN
jgi:hypothetical protein